MRGAGVRDCAVEDCGSPIVRAVRVSVAIAEIKIRELPFSSLG